MSSITGRLRRIGRERGMMRLTLVALTAAWLTLGPGSDPFRQLRADDLVWRHQSGLNAFWYVKDSERYTSAFFSPNYDPDWKIVGTGFFYFDATPPPTCLLWRNVATGQNAIWTVNEVGVVVHRIEVQPCDLTWTAAGTGDFNGDGKTDILWRNYTDGANAIWFMDGPNRIGSQTIEALADTDWEIKATGDFNRDGKPDLLWRNKVTGNCAIWYIDLAQAPVLGRVRSALLNPELLDLDWTMVATGDFNGDDYVDILWRHRPTGQLAVWHMLDEMMVSTINFSPNTLTPDWELVGSAPVWASVAARASISTAPVGLKLEWRKQPAEAVTVQKRSGASWTPLATGVTNSAFLDTSVVTGQAPEYLLGTRYLATANNARLEEYRGKVIVLVDQTLYPSLTNEMRVLKEDLVADGWRVLLHQAPRHNDTDWSANPAAIQQVKTMIQTDYNASPADTKAVYIIGHVAIPYSGSVANDGHFEDHAGAWPCDGYYGELTGTTWTDTIQMVRSAFPENYNLPGDGKFDQDVFESPLELAVGRVDFARMPALGVKPPVGTTPDPKELMYVRRYLDKSRRYRYRDSTVQFTDAGRAIAAGYFGNSSDGPTLYEAGNNRKLFNDAIRATSAWFGMGRGRVIEGDLFVDKKKALLGIQGGWGCANAINCGMGNQHDVAFLTVANNEPPIGFYLLFGSYFGDWNQQDNLLRACLSTPNYGLGTYWNSHQYGLQGLAVGRPIGLEFKRAINENQSLFPGERRERERAFLGDPTLRILQPAPPTRLVAASNANGVRLAWTASVDAGARYNVYGTDSLDAPLVRLHLGSIGTTTFDPPRRTIYVVRTVVQRSTASGTYSDLSQGAMYWVR